MTETEQERGVSGVDVERIKERVRVAAHVGWRDGSAELADVLSLDVPALLAGVARLQRHVKALSQDVPSRWRAAIDDLQQQNDALVQRRVELTHSESRLIQENDRLKAQLAEAQRERQREYLAHELTKAEKTGVEIENQALKAVVEAVRKHYPTIAGRVIQLTNAGEDRAADEWSRVAHAFYDALAALDQHATATAQ